MVKKNNIRYELYCIVHGACADADFLLSACMRSMSPPPGSAVWPQLPAERSKRWQTVARPNVKPSPHRIIHLIRA